MARHLEQILEEQIRRWERENLAFARKKVRYPVITISREFGARGAALARLLGDRTGFTVWDQELVKAIAEEAGADARLLASLDEHHREAIEDAINATLLGGSHTNVQYLRTLMRVVKTIAHHGRSIIVGRGANYILRSRDMLSVRVVCPFELRVKRYAEAQGLDEREARRRVEARDAERAEFVRHNFRRDVNNAADYDLVLNAGTFDLESLAGLVAHAYELKTGLALPVVTA
ncbi:cytidylate kinase-like family protein [Rhodocaloribacter litoris]|uniref:cytidylate kinase-like family protein n=1 Tax=Rhodocaloribacter litoris TaxID=2558931 RepID=UPI0014234FBD|nr:cytidylate kinase-like family protein [Rhodocaloribacter litoris]QXD16357.1 cytidylate kinase-like family protein [Rhodocaloribacter litoris]